MSNRDTVCVGLSGGVDSSVAALRLLREGYNVIGVFIKVWHPDFLPCNWEAERRDAMRVAAHLDIPFLTCDAEQTYFTSVAQYFIAEYRAGRTPNPDVMCNQHIKFGAFLDFAQNIGAKYIATGHYAQVQKTSSGSCTLWRGKDQNKDQSYFLWSLTQNQLQSSLLPNGAHTKNEIRREAESAELPTAEKKDSQGICFLGHVDLPDFLSHFIDLTEGDLILSDGTVIGSHQGAVVYTIGQRHGFTVTDPSCAGVPYFVTATDHVANTVTVSRERPVREPHTELHLSPYNLIGTSLHPGDQVSIQVRYRQEPIAASVTHVAADTLSVALESHIDGGAEGQSCVLYRAEQCLGGGIIAK
jgi:tRNA-specific 2-thiouridylase